MSASAGVRYEDEGPWPTALIEHHGRWVTLHSRRDPIAEALQSLDAVTNDAPLVVLIGVGLGYALDGLERRGCKARVLGIEVEPALTGLMRSRRDWTTWNGHLTLLDANALGNDLWRLFAGVGAEPPVLVHPVLRRVRPEAVARAEAAVARAWFEHRANEDAKRENAGRYLLNTLRNGSAIAAGADARSLDSLFEGVPAVVVGAGPTLDENLPALIKYRRRAVVVAVDTALRPLVAAGVVPDIVVAVDPSETNGRHLCDLPRCSDTWLVTEGSVAPEALPHFEGRAFFFRVGDHHPWPWLESVGLGRTTLRAWGSVLTTAFDLTLRMGCAPILFAGADLAFTGGRPYARGTTFEEDWQRGEAFGQPVEAQWRAAIAAWPVAEEPGVDGVTVRTAPHLRAFRDWLAAEARKHAHRIVINATGRGILHGAAIHQGSLGDTLDAVAERGAATSLALTQACADGRGRFTRVPAPPADVMSDWMRFGGNVTEGEIARALGGPPPRVRPDGGTRAAPSAVKIALACDALAVDGDERDDLEWLVSEAQELAAPGVIALGAGAVGAAILAAVAMPVTAKVLVDSPIEPARLLAGRVGLEADTIALCGEGDAATLVILACSHATDDVSGALARALAYLRPGGYLAVLDQTQAAAAVGVRRALQAVLERRPDLRLYEPRLWNPARRLSWLRPVSDRASTALDLEKWSESSMAAATSLVPLIAARCRPRSVLDMGAGAGHWIDAFLQEGDCTVQGIEDPDYVRASGGGPHEKIREGALSAAEFHQAFDLCLCLNVVQRLPLSEAEGLVGTCTKSADVVAFSVAAPGVGLDSHVTERPWSHWHEVFARYGFVCSDEIRPIVEAQWSRPRNTFDLVVIYRRVRGTEDVRDAYLAAMARVDDLVQQRLWFDGRLRIAERDCIAPARAPLAIRPEQMREVVAGVRVYRPRTRTARTMLRRSGTLRMFEDGRPLVRAPRGLSIDAWGDGWFRLDGDEVTFTAGDGSDPRVNGYRYSIEMESALAYLEGLPRHVIEEHRL